MLNKEERAFIKKNKDKLSLKEMADKLGMRAKILTKEIKRLEREHPAQPVKAGEAGKYRPGSISSSNIKKVIGCAIFIFIATFSVYFNTMENDFIWDDEYLILNNSQVKSFSHIDNVFKTYVGFGSENVNTFYRPLQELSNMLDYFLWGEDPMGFHLTNVLLHSAFAILAFIFIFYVSANIPVAFIAALLLGVHPVNTEAVAYIAGRADSLYSIFFLLSLISFVRYSGHIIKGKNCLMLIISANIFFILALLSKEVSLVLPLLVILYIFFLC